MPTDLTIRLEDAEVQEILQVAAEAGIEGTETAIRAFAAEEAKAGLRDKIAALVMEQQRQSENERRRNRLAEFDAAWPKPADPADEDITSEPEAV